MKIRKHIRNTQIICFVLFVTSCSLHIHSLSLSSPNPTNYVFPYPSNVVREKILEALSIEHQINHPIFGHSIASSIFSHLESDLSVECATNSIFGTQIFTNPANTQDVYLHSFGLPFTTSPIYRGRKGGLPFIANFHLHFTSDGSSTVISITALDTKVINGQKFGIGPCGPGEGNNYVKVKPTTIEEYTILRYLGGYLGATNMPEVILPKRL